MNIDKAKFNQVVGEAKKKAANSPEWLRAIEKAAGMLASGELVVTLFADNTALVTSPNGSYRVNGACPCASRASHCYHRAAKRLVEMMEETKAGVGPCFTADVAVSQAVKKTTSVNHASCFDRPALIADIKSVWPKTWPPLYTELLARYGKSHLEMLDDDSLRRVRLAIAM